jgi:transposase
VNVTRQRTKLDFAGQMKELVDVHYPHARQVTLVMDNLNTHRLSCLYEAFRPEEARRILEKIEVVHTPKHGSWLNMAECELSVIEKQCLGERIPDSMTLRQRVDSWETDRNNRSKKIDWQFETADARIKLRRLYPKIQMS